jgi:ABC-type branched-subunit amino acid transport system substrate-binding protein
LSRCDRQQGLRRTFPALGCALAAFMLAACQSIPIGPRPADPAAPAAPTAEILGTGGTRVALLAPRSASGNGRATAEAFRNAAELALRDFPSAGIQVAVYDTKGTPAGAEAAVGVALSEGAEIILGPVFSSEVSAVAQASRAAGVPVVAFSSDAGVAGPGVYLLSFLPSDDVERIVSYSVREGRRSFAAMLPQNAYGSVVEAAFRSNVASAGGRIVAIETYQTAEDVRTKAARIAAIAPQIDALLIPDTGEVVPAIAASLAASGVTRDRVRLLGSGQWDDSRVLNSPALVGSWFPAPAKQGFEGFARKYQAAYGAPPPRNATLAYDATVLAAGLLRQSGGGRPSASALTNPNGFAGLDGVFRFLPNGLTQRRLAIYEVTGSGARIVDPASRSFAAGG